MKTKGSGGRRASEIMRSEYSMIGHSSHIEEEGALFSWRDINVSTCPSISGARVPLMAPSAGSTKQLVEDATGVARPGELLAIMGASGAGKSTLLNALTSRNLKGLQVTGARLVNNCPVTADRLMAISAYMQQDDLFIGTLTLKEHLTFQAMVRMNKIIPAKLQRERVNEVMDDLGLRKSENVQIGAPGNKKGISRGEMKRLALASELLINPPIFFCDEPTSGLDSSMAVTVMQSLKKLASQGRTVLFTIHQPSSEIYGMFDKILLMADGKMAFLGNTSDANQFFASCSYPCPPYYNPPDHFINVLAMHGDELHRSKEGKERCKRNIAIVTRRYSQTLQSLEAEQKKVEEQEEIWGEKYCASWCTQFRALLWRSWISTLKEPALIKMWFFKTIWQALIIILIYYHQDYDQAGVVNINGVIFISIMNVTFGSAVAVINVFCSEIPIFLREHFNGLYRTDVYFITKQLADLPIFFITPLIFVGMFYFAVGLNPLITRFAIAYGIMELITQVVISFGYFVSCISSSLPIALGINSALMVPLAIFGGVFIQTGSAHTWMSWISWFSWFLYGNEALLINQWAGVDNIKCELTNATYCLVTGKDVLDESSVNEDSFWFDINVLAGQALLFKCAAFLALLYKTRRQAN